jgi:hypothetical protein
MLKGPDDGDRQMVKILSAVLTDGLAAVEAACAEALAGGVHSADVVLNILARRRDPGPVATILTPRTGVISLEEVCRRYELSVEEFLAWQRAIDTHRVPGLRVTRLQIYRDNPPSRVAKPRC